MVCSIRPYKKNKYPRMKKIIYLISIILFFIGNSCSDYLEAPPSVDLDEDGVFADRTLTEQYITGIYAEGMPLGFSMSSSNTDRRLGASSTLGGACDEAEEGAAWGKGNSAWNVSNHNNNSIDWDEDPRHNLRWATLRKCNTVLERIDEVPDDPGDPDFKKRSKGEAYFMRALVFWEGVYRYGGLPIIHHRIKPNEDAKLPRNTFAQCVDSILIDCDRASGLLPDYYADATKVGRATRIAALALKSRVLLYAASPLFNTNTPYMQHVQGNTLIGYGDFDNERWKKASDAAKDAIDAVNNSGHYRLYSAGTPETNYEYIWTTPDNEEIILANKKYRGFATNNRPLTGNLPLWGGGGWSDGGLFATFNFVKFYEKKNGEKQTWNMAGGDDLIEKYRELDPRFDQTIGTHGAVWNNEIGVLNFLPGGAHNVATDKTKHLVRKWVPRTLRASSPRNSLNIDWIVFRVAELYLNYAEALNEYNSAPPIEAFQAVEAVRERSGMPPFPSTLTKNAFRDKIRNERAVELAFEDHRFWDIRRWVIAEQEGVMRGDMYGLKLAIVAGQPDKTHYTPYVFEKRLWNSRSYLHPIKQNEIDKDYMVQNPGW